MIKKLIEKLRSKKPAPKYAQCLHHRTWLSRQVQEEIIKRDYKTAVTGTESNVWYSRYL